MVVIVWEFRVKAEARAAFERAYGSDGDWARLFRRAAGYLGTELLRDAADSARYLTIDRWSSPAAFDDFRRDFAQEYEETDRRCAELTESETRVGIF